MRYVDDFAILHHSKEQLKKWKEQINKFLKSKLKLELHPDKSNIIQLSRGVDFVGFRNFHKFRLLRKRNIRSMSRKVELFKQGKLDEDAIWDSFQGWQAYAKWANTYKLRNKFQREIAAGAAG